MIILFTLAEIENSANMIVLFISILFGYLFNNLARKHKKNRWFWVISGFIGYNIVQFFIGIGFRIIGKTDMLSSFNPTLINITGLIIGISIVYLTYWGFRNKWMQEDTRFKRDEIYEIGNLDN